MRLTVKSFMSFTVKYMSKIFPPRRKCGRVSETFLIWCISLTASFNCWCPLFELVIVSGNHWEVVHNIVLAFVDITQGGENYNNNFFNLMIELTAHWKYNMWYAHVVILFPNSTLPNENTRSHKIISYFGHWPFCLPNHVPFPVPTHPFLTSSNKWLQVHREST